MDDKVKAEIIEKVVVRLCEAMNKESLSPRGAPIWLNIIYLLDLFNSGTFHGKISLVIKEDVCDNMKIVEKTNKLQEKYLDIMNLINKK